MPKYYIASGLENAAAVKELKAVLDGAGWQHTYDWTAHGAVWSEGAERLSGVAERELHGVMHASVLVVLLPGGRGTHTELGVSLGAWLFGLKMEEYYAGLLGKVVGKRVVIYSSNPKDFEIGPEPCAFYHHPLVERFSSMDEMIKSLLGDPS